MGPLTAQHAEPASEEAQDARPFSRRNGGDPMVHATGRRVRRDELGQRSAQEALQKGDEDEAVNDCSGSTGSDLRDQTQSQARPRNGRGRGQADETKHTEVALEFLRVALGGGAREKLAKDHQKESWNALRDIDSPICARRSSSAFISVLPSAPCGVSVSLEPIVCDQN